MKFSSSTWPLSHFAYGADFFPEFLPRETWLRMLDQLVDAQCNMIRLGASEWGVLEPALGAFRFDLVTRWVDDCTERGLDCLLGTGSYITPQWLIASHPEIVHQPPGGATFHSIGRKSACINHPVYREAVLGYVRSLVSALGQHSGIVGWQIDNEIDALLAQTCHCAVCEKAWTDWLARRFGSVERLNDELGLHYWGFQVASLSDLKLPREMLEAKSHPALKLAERFFRRDCILEFLGLQAAALREAGARGWLLHDFMNCPDLSSNSLQEEDIFDLRGNNTYFEFDHHSRAARTGIFDHIRNVHGQGAFLITETSAGAIGGETFWGEYSTPTQFRFRLLYLTAQGGNGILYWSGNAWHGGPWPLWRAMFDYENQPEIDFERYREFGAFISQWGDVLLAHPPLAEAAFVHDYENELYATIYPFHPQRKELLPAALEPLRRLGWGIDGLPPRRLRDAELLSCYKLIILIDNACLDDPCYTENLRAYVEQGGILVVGPLVNFQEKGGVFRRQGLGGNFEGLCGARVRSFRAFGSREKSGEFPPCLRWEDPEDIFSGESEILTGLSEVLEVNPGSEVIGRFCSSDPSVEGMPAAVRRRLGKGAVYRFAAWPEDWSRFVPRLAQPAVRFLEESLPPGAQSIPRTDGSLFIFNGSPVSIEITLRSALRDRLTDQVLTTRRVMQPYGALWLEKSREG